MSFYPILSGEEQGNRKFLSKIGIVRCRENFYNSKGFYVLSSAAMDNYRSLFVAVLCLFLIPFGTSQETIYISPEEAVWDNPYPGLGNVSPGSVNVFSSNPSLITLYADERGIENTSELSPIMKSTELYLSRFPNNKRTGMFQKVNFNTLWSPAGSGSKGLGMTELDLSVMFALPLPTPDSPLLLTPKFSATFFDYKQGGNDTLYTTGLGMRWIRPLVKNKLTADLGVGVHYSGDFYAKGSDTIRVPVHVAGIWNFNPRTKIILGVAYLDRHDNFNWFPMAGLIWTPNDDLSVELVAPRLRVAQRIRWFGSAAGDEQSDWLYTAFEFGGGSWGMEFAPSYSGNVDYRDLRLLLGYERRTRCGLTLGLEIGYMFERHLEFDGTYKERPADSVFLRLRSSF